MEKRNKINQVIVIALVALIVTLTGCVASKKPSEENGNQEPVEKRSSITLRIAETLPSCVAFEHKDGTPYCFYAYDDEGKLYRVLWTNFDELNERDVIVVGYSGSIRKLDQINPPGGWTPQYEITAISVKKEVFHEQVPVEAMLNLEIINGKFRFQRIATTPCIVYSNTRITEMSNGTMYDDGQDILTAIFRATDGKDAIMDITDCAFAHYIYMFDDEREDTPWHYRFAICNCGAVMITNNDELICTVKITEEEIQSILTSFELSGATDKE